MACFVEDMSGTFHSISSLLRLTPRTVARHELPAAHPLFLKEGDAANIHVGHALVISPSETLLAVVGRGETSFVMDFVSMLSPGCPVFFQGDLYAALAKQIKPDEYQHISPVLLWHFQKYELAAPFANEIQRIQPWLTAIRYDATAPREQGEACRAVQL